MLHNIGDGCLECVAVTEIVRGYLRPLCRCCSSCPARIHHHLDRNLHVPLFMADEHGPFGVPQTRDKVPGLWTRRYVECGAPL